MALRSPLVAVAVLLAFVNGCAAASEDGEDSQGPIVGGTLDTEGGAVVALRVGVGPRAELCSATVIAPNVLLTARHCVSKSLTKTIICNAKGESENGPHFGDDHPVSDLRVYTGTKPDFDGPVSAEVRQIVKPDASIVCNQDIALVVLDRPLEGIDPLAVRRARQVGVQETIRSVGYGKTDTGSTGQRLRKAGVVVRAIGPGLSSSETALGANEFEVGVSICHGDSGGPAISQSTGAVIGVVSRGGDCGEDFGHVYTATSGFGELIDHAIQIAGATPAQIEPEPPPGDKSVKPGATPPKGDSGCQISATAGVTAGGNAVGFTAFALGLAVSLRRRRRRSSAR